MSFARSCVVVAALAAAVACNLETGTPVNLVDSVVVAGDSTVVINGTTQLTASALVNGTPLGGAGFLWLSTDSETARVNGSGLVSGLTLDTITILAEAVVNRRLTGVRGGKVLRVRLKRVVVTSTPPTLNTAGQQVSLAAEARDALDAALPGISFLWQSRNPPVASVDGATGVVTANADGTAYVVATVPGERESDSVEVTVTLAAAASRSPGRQPGVRRTPR